MRQPSRDVRDARIGGAAALECAGRAQWRRRFGCDLNFRDRNRSDDSHTNRRQTSRTNRKRCRASLATALEDT
jgi:hypothetical protein